MRDFDHSKTIASKKALFFLACCWLPFLAWTQSNSGSAAVLPPQKDLVEVLFKKKQVLADPDAPRVPDTLVINKLYPSLLPIVGYNPALGFVAGGGISAGLLLGPQASTHISSALFNVTYTTKNQLNFNFRSNLYLKNDRWILQSDFRFLLFQQNTHGLGVNFQNDKHGLFGMNPMDFNYLRLYQNAFYALGKRWYAGLGLQYDGHSAIEDNNYDPTTGSTTPHTDYQVNNQMPLDKYRTFGYTLNALYDNRDNAINTWGGQYFQFQYRFNPGFLSTAASSSVFVDYRNYKAFATRKATPAVLAFWTWTQVKLSGAIPYLALPAISWDTYNRSGRGYVQGRIRGENMWYGETEYRFPINANGLLGGVGFFNLTSASDRLRGQKLFQAFAPGYGLGLRVKMNKRTRTNIGIDYGWGPKGNQAIYFNLQEAF